MIPRIINYFWIAPIRYDGGEQRDTPSDFVLDCIRSVVALHPDWYFQIWDEVGTSWPLTLIDIDAPSLPSINIFDDPAIKAICRNPLWTRQRLNEYRGADNPLALLADFYKGLVLYAVGGFILDLDMFGIRPLDKFLGDKLLLAEVRSELISEAMVAAPPLSYDSREILVKYFADFNPEGGSAHLNLSWYAWANRLPSYPSEYFIGATRGDEGERIYGTTVNTHTLHCWHPHDRYDIHRLRGLVGG